MFQSKMKEAEEARIAAQQHFQAVSAGLSSNIDGQAETLAAQKIGNSHSVTLVTLIACVHEEVTNAHFRVFTVFIAFVSTSNRL